MKKTYVEIWYPSPLASKTEVRLVDDRDSTKFQAPENCFGYRFFDREVIFPGDEPVLGKPQNYSGMFYFGKIVSIEDIKEEFPNSDNLVKLLQAFGWNKIIKTRCGHFREFNNIDSIVAKE